MDKFCLQPFAGGKRLLEFRLIIVLSALEFREIFNERRFTIIQVGDNVRARPTFGSGHDIRHPQGWLDCSQLRQTSSLCRQL